jgi:hypothetical protein
VDAGAGARGARETSLIRADCPAFAEREGLEPARLYSWRGRLGVSSGQRLAASAARMTERAAFVEVQAHRPSRIKLVLRTGHVLFLPDSFDADALSRLVEVLERASEC